MGKGWLAQIWKMIPLAIWWCTWTERRQHIFEGIASISEGFIS